MTINGTIYKVLPKQSGTTKAGKEWQKAEFIIETKDQYPKKIKVAIMKTDLIDQFEKLHPGDEIEASINLESREWSDKWFTEATAWKIELKGSSGPYNKEEVNTNSNDSDESQDSLPF